MEQRNIVFICLDTVRKDYFDKFSKRIKRLSDIDFDEAYAASSWSVPSHGTMLTGQLPSDHGVHTHNLDFGSINQTVLDELEGYQRIGVSANGYANSNFNFDGYFDEFFEVYSGMDNLAGLNVRDFVNDLDDDLSITSYISFLKATLGHEQTIASLRNGAKALLNERLSETNIVPTPFDKGAQLVCKTTINRINESSEPFFAFMNVMDAHEPHRDCLKYDESKYDVPFGWSSDGKDYVFGNTTSVDEDYFKELYGASIDYLDRVISSFVRDLRSRTNAETTIIISADHGDNLREPTSYGQWGHVYTKHLTDGLLHVPLAIINPPSEMNMDPSRLISHLDLPDLFRDFAGLKNFSQDRKKIVAETIGTGSLGRVYMDEDISEEEYQEWDQSLRLVEKDGVRVEWNSNGDCFEHREGELSKIDELPEWAVSEFKDPISEYKEKWKDQNDDLSDGIMNRLRDLGYA